MKILHINCSDVGSTGKIICEIAKESEWRGWKSILCAPMKIGGTQLKVYYTSLKYEQGLYRRFCYLGFLRYGFAPLSTYKILNIISKENPDIVHLHSSNCNMVNIYALLRYLKHHDIATVVTNHAEFFYTGSCSHAFDCNQWIEGCKKCESLFDATLSKTFDFTAYAWEKMKQSFEGFKRIQIVSVSEWVNNRSKSSGILGGLPNMTIKNGIDTNVFRINYSNKIRLKYNIPKAKKVLLHVTACFSSSKNHLKGGYYIIELAKMLFNKDVIIFIAGTNCVDASTLPSNIICVGNLLNQSEMAAFYSMADLTILTSRRETYGMCVAESLCCGTPVVSFLAGGPESIALKDYTRFVEYGDMTSYKTAVDELIDMKETIPAEQISRDGIAEYSSDKMAKEYNNVYNSLISIPQ